MGCVLIWARCGGIVRFSQSPRVGIYLNVQPPAEHACDGGVCSDRLSVTGNQYQVYVRTIWVLGNLICQLAEKFLLITGDAIHDVDDEHRIRNHAIPMN